MDHHLQVQENLLITGQAIVYTGQAIIDTGINKVYTRKVNISNIQDKTMLYVLKTMGDKL